MSVRRFDDPLNAGPPVFEEAMNGGPAPTFGGGPRAPLPALEGIDPAAPPRVYGVSEPPLTADSSKQLIASWRDHSGEVRPSLLDRMIQHPEIAADDPLNFVLSQQPTRAAHLRLSEQEEKIVWSWAISTGQANAIDPRDPASTLQFLRRLLTVRLAPDTEEGKRTEDALIALGVIPKFSAKMIAHLRQDLGSHALPKGVHFHYNGHLNPQILSLFVGLDRLGLESASVTRSAQSGTPPIPKILQSRFTNAPTFGGLYAFRAWRTEPSVAPFSGQTRNQSLTERVLESVKKNELFILDKVSDLLEAKPLPADLVSALKSGRVRVIVHNRHDRDLIDELPKDVRDNLWAVDLSASRLKAFEATVIADQYVAEAKKSVSAHFGQKLEDTDVVIVGHGLLGSAISASLVAAGFSKDRIFVRDADPKVEEEAVTQGLKRHEKPREKAVLFVATPGEAVNAANLGSLAKESISFVLTSGGTGVNIPSLEAAKVKPAEVVKERTGGFDFATGKQKSFPDLSLEIPGARTIVAAKGQSVNLVEPGDWHRHAALSGGGGGLTLALLAATRLEKPGIVKPSDDPVWAAHEEQGMKIVHELGLG
jgi:hypothetical protein